ncbi:uncharacterized protein SPSK_02367 [Sporothrix schenckii 1099-18]|uniref:RNA polymerase II holoenzyme cyclin-like subunit n=1 Tax=Sporothrix schenckii 1099-18 TaxID=1397361 RepID=A0A0F2MCF1_SPOSC|nr:uncharacterized protein SPSK_02367 [Sporothrix schenckii 1099-18]KJR86754.1 hypothetical protein SPSK_02367 [Sporothrix schenckii 1099-18]
MASLDRFRASREAYQPPHIPQPSKSGAPPASAAPSIPPAVPTAPTSITTSALDRQSLSQSPSSSRRRDVPPAVPSPPTHSSRNSPPHRRPLSRRSASPRRDGVLPQHNGSVTSQPRLPTASPARNAAHDSNRNQPPFASQWFFSDNELLSTPSILHGLSPAEERERRSKGVNFIYQSGIAVRPHPLPQMTLYVAAIFFHRFYMRTSMVEERGGIHHYKIAATAMFLANKTEENCFKTKNIIVAVAKVAQKNMDLVVDEQSKEYWRWRDVILTYEELMLETLTFDLVVANPYDQLWSQLRKLGQLGTKPVREAAWTFLNDSALTTLPLALDASDLASASIFFASIATGATVDDVQSRPWWQHLRADETRITRATHAMVAFYTDNPLKKQQASGRVVAQGSPVFQLEATRRPQELAQLNSRSLDHNSNGNSHNNSHSNSHSNGHSNSNSGHSHQPTASRDVTPLELDQRQPQPPPPPPQQTRGRGDSDAALKAAANDLDHHPSHYANSDANANGLAGRLAPNGDPASTRKRKSVEPDDHLLYRDRDRDRHDRHSEGIEEGEYKSSSPPPAKRARRTSEGEVSDGA